MSAASRFAALHHGPDLLVLPNCWDVASAVLLAAAGFPAIGTTSLGITAAAGLPDGAGAGRDLTVALAAALVPRLEVPLTVDLEGGYSDDPAEVAEVAVQLAEVGVAGINLEDGRAEGRLRSVDEYAAIVRAVTAAAPALFVNARTDTWWLGVGPEAGRVDETLHRVTAYRDAGASGVFVPGLADLALVERVATTAEVPLNVLWSPGTSLVELRSAGVARVSTGSALYRHSLAAALGAATAARDGRAPTGAALDYAGLQRLLRDTSPRTGPA